jgi:hypothetical protein
MTRYYGVLASHHRLRERVIPRPAAPPPPPQLPLDFDPAESSPTSSPRPRRIAWAKLLARVFALDITRCRKCGGRMRVLEVVSDADAIARILHGARAPACASSSWTGPVVRLTARPFGDVFTRLRLAAVLTAPLGPRTGRFVTLALPLAPGPCQNPPTARSPPLAGLLRTHPRPQIPTSNRLSARRGRSPRSCCASPDGPRCAERSSTGPGSRVRASRSGSSTRPAASSAGIYTRSRARRGCSPA